jgi:hypothetical protein
LVDGQVRGDAAHVGGGKPPGGVEVGVERDVSKVAHATSRTARLTWRENANIFGNGFRPPDDPPVRERTADLVTERDRIARLQPGHLGPRCCAGSQPCTCNLDLAVGPAQHRPIPGVSGPVRRFFRIGLSRSFCPPVYGSRLVALRRLQWLDASRPTGRGSGIATGVVGLGQQLCDAGEHDRIGDPRPQSLRCSGPRDIRGHVHDSPPRPPGRVVTKPPCSRGETASAPEALGLCLAGLWTICPMVSLPGVKKGLPLPPVLL